MKKIIAFIGVIGSGKDYASGLASSQYGAKIFDFSQGVRDVTFGFLGYTPDCSKDYIEFKSHENRLTFPTEGGIDAKRITGRKFLENVGITMRNYDPDFWAKYCYNKAIDHITHDNPEHIVFNAVRYQNEADYVKRLADDCEAEVQFIFTNYKSPRYEVRNDDSEEFAQKFLAMGFEHLTDITDFV